MAVFSKDAAVFPLPVFHKVQQIIPDEKLEDIPGAIAAEMGKEEVRSRLTAGKTAAVLVGSRGIDNLPVIVKSVIEQLKKYGILPFIVPAMGSHGGGVAENQRAIIEGYGITEAAMGVPIPRLNGHHPDCNLRDGHSGLCRQKCLQRRLYHPDQPH